KNLSAKDARVAQWAQWSSRASLPLRPWRSLCGLCAKNSLRPRPGWVCLLLLLPRHAVMGPEQACGDGSPGTPPFPDFHHRLDVGPRLEPQRAGHGRLQSNITRGPDVGTPKIGHEIDVGRPWSDSGRFC